MYNSVLPQNQKYKDNLFCTIFGREENKPFLLDLYNALNHSSYTNLDDFKFTTIENVIYLTMKNDVSFIVGNELNLYEHQSTFNPNMPLRGLMYYAQAYQQYLSNVKKNLYSSTLVKIPCPKFIVFYNGNKEIEDISKLYLSDSFEKVNLNDSDLNSNSIQQKEFEKEFEWTATVININRNHNLALLKSCKSLYDYSEFVAMVKQNLRAGNEKSIAIKAALDEAIKKNFFNGYLKKSKMEVLNMSLTEFDQEEYENDLRTEGAQNAKLETARNFIKMNLPLEQIAFGTGLSLTEIEKLKQEMEVFA